MDQQHDKDKQVNVIMLIVILDFIQNNHDFKFEVIFRS
jgi:hypothetical protein